MTYAQACAIFGFSMNDRLEKKEIRKRFNKLVLKYHPDHGGTSEQFQMLREAQKIVETHRHDKHEDRQQQGTAGPNFKKVNVEDVNNTIHRQNADREEYRTLSSTDLIVFLAMMGFMTSTYLVYAWRSQERLTRSRWRMTEDKVQGQKSTERAASVWHPWKASQEERDQMYTIGVIQGSVKRELMERRQEQVPYIPHPLVPRPSGAFGVSASGATGTNKSHDLTEQRDSDAVAEHQKLVV